MTALASLDAVLGMLDGARHVRRVCDRCGLSLRVCECPILSAAVPVEAPAAVAAPTQPAAGVRIPGQGACSGAFENGLVVSHGVSND